MRQDCYHEFLMGVKNKLGNIFNTPAENSFPGHGIYLIHFHVVTRNCVFIDIPQLYIQGSLSWSTDNISSLAFKISPMPFSRLLAHCQNQCHIFNLIYYKSWCWAANAIASIHCCMKTSWKQHLKRLVHLYLVII